ncbi:hypothetical protein H4683_003681 [Filibacter limicola]|uniref:Uncharacterized protein n=1 Tax=Sporosarcina limicola TaxID=34101 RepID=A0A927MSH8_9BACL|nr:hypothetical protein [Sporosarcina limicola]
MFLKNFFKVLVVLLIFLSVNTSASAHIGTICNAGSESTGWIVDCKL